jgi:2-amino-4-hydroxy-6-hydroxymethyldihydropteridine diphosphokinase
MPAHMAYILLGSNQGHRQWYLQQATAAIAVQCGTVIKASSLYETAAWGKTDQPAFLNQVVLVAVRLAPEQLMQTLLQIERELGRKRTEKMGPRTIDLDILFYDQLICHTPLLTLPHPLLQERRFVLTPLAELAPGKIHPVYRKTIRTLLQQCSDPLPVKKL